jgi:hypothetical protein
MYGHAVAELHRLGLPPGDDVVERAHRGLAFLLEQRRRTPGGLVALCHPWESGCDDSPRWDGVMAEGRTAERWFAVTGELVASVERSPGGAPLHNPAFPVGGVGFSALVAWNALELATATGDDRLVAAAEELAAAVDDRWDPALRTWVDDGPTAATSGRIRTLDALLPVLVAPRADALTEVTDPEAFGAPCGPRGVHPDEPAYEPATYWRGSAWPQLTYLVWLAATSSGDRSTASTLLRSMVTGVERSGYAEHWVADTGAALGAVPQSWSTLVLAMRAGR